MTAIQQIASTLQAVQSDLLSVRTDLGEVKQIVKSHDERFNQQDTAIIELQEAIQVLSSDTDHQFVTIADQFNKRFIKIESQMVTKDYLDEKMGTLRGDMIQRIRTGFPKLAH